MKNFFGMVVKEIDLYIASIMLLGITALVIIQIILRLAGVPLRWSEEVARIFNIWMVFAILGRAAYGDKHIKIDYFQNKLPGLFRKITKGSILLLNVFTVSYVAYSSVTIIRDFWGSRTPAAGIPRHLLFFATLFSMLSLFIIYLYRFYLLVWKGEE